MHKKLLISLFFLFICVSLFAQQSSKLQAILIVGHQQDATQNAINKMDDIAKTFQDNGVLVHKFYDHNANWNEIISVAKSCNFLVYSGHGSNMGVNGNVGGLCLNTMVSSLELIKKLKLKPHSMVLFQSVCYGAGTSAGDDGDIGVDVAKKRVTNYAYPFFNIGAEGYYADNYQNGVSNFLKLFFKGATLKEGFTKSAAKWSTIECDEDFPNYQGKFISIASGAGGGQVTKTTYVDGVKKVETFTSEKDYPIAAAGNASLTINHMK